MLSKRLKTVADLVTKGNVVADVGTDHGYVPIYLVEEEISPYCYAMDVNEGPLNKAKANIIEHELEDKIETILSDGLDAFGDRKADTIIISGMGGDLIVEILSRANDFDELILSPHKRADLVRKYLADSGYEIIDEKMVEERNKYYQIIKAKKGECLLLKEEEVLYGPFLLKHKDEKLKAFLEHEYKKLSKIKSELEREDKELDKEIDFLKSALEYYE